MSIQHLSTIQHQLEHLPQHIDVIYDKLSTTHRPSTSAINCRSHKRNIFSNDKESSFLHIHIRQQVRTVCMYVRMQHYLDVALFPWKTDDSCPVDLAECVRTISSDLTVCVRYRQHCVLAIFTYLRVLHVFAYIVSRVAISFKDKMWNADTQ